MNECYMYLFSPDDDFSFDSVSFKAIALFVSVPFDIHVRLVPYVILSHIPLFTCQHHYSRKDEVIFSQSVTARIKS